MLSWSGCRTFGIQACTFWMEAWRGVQVWYEKQSGLPSVLLVVTAEELSALTQQTVNYTSTYMWCWLSRESLKASNFMLWRATCDSSNVTISVIADDETFRNFRRKRRSTSSVRSFASLYAVVRKIILQICVCGVLYACIVCMQMPILPVCGRKQIRRGEGLQKVSCP